MSASNGKATEAVDQYRRRILDTATMGMPTTLPTRRAILATSAAAGAVGLLPLLVDTAGQALAQPSDQGDSQMLTKADAIRPFSINFPEEALVDLRRRINATKWPDQEQVTDDSQGVRL